MLSAPWVGRTHPGPGGSHLTTRDGVVRDCASSGHDAGTDRNRRRRDETVTRPHADPELATDLVEYFVVVLPDRGSLAGVVPAVTDMVASQRIRVLDIVVLDRGADGASTWSRWATSRTSWRCTRWRATSGC